MTDTRTEGKSGADKSSAAGSTYEATRAKTSAAYTGARDRASNAAGTATAKLQSNPVVAIAGGFAVGAVLAAVLPNTRRETELFGGVGGKITDAARDAAHTAVEAGRAQVEELTESAATKVGQAVIGAVTASASGAASGSASDGNAGGTTA